MTKKLNQSFPVGDNPFQVFRKAPTSVELLIHNLPHSILPDEPTHLFPSLLESIRNAIYIPIFAARFLQSRLAKRAEKRTTSVVLIVDPLHVSRFGESIPLFSCAHTVAPTFSASQSTQCRKCWRFGHSAPLCKEEAQACLICTLLHHRSDHRCANQSCPKGGFEKSVLGCCNASPPPCINCGGQHTSWMAPVLSAAESSALSGLSGTKAFTMPAMRASLKPPLRVQLLLLFYRLHQPGTPLTSLHLGNLHNPRPLNLFAACPPCLTSPLPSPAGTSLVLGAPSSELGPVPTGVSLRRLTSTWIFRCRQTQI